MKAKGLFLRQILPEDQQSIFKGLSNPEVIRYYGVRYNSYEATKEQMEWYEGLWLTGTGVWWAICSEDNECFYGACGFNNIREKHKKAEIGFWLLPEYWGRGIIPKAASLAITYAFQTLHLQRIEAFVEGENISSKKALEKLKFEYEGTMVDAEQKEGKYISLDIYAKRNGT